MLQPFPGAHLSGSSGQQALRVKAVALFERSARFSACKYAFPPPHSPRISFLSALLLLPRSPGEGRQPVLARDVGVAVPLEPVEPAPLAAVRDAVRVQRGLPGAADRDVRRDDPPPSRRSRGPAAVVPEVPVGGERDGGPRAAVEG